MNDTAPVRVERAIPWQGRSVVVVGAGVSGVAAAKLLAACGARVTATDSRPASDIPGASELAAAGVELIAGGHPDDLWADAGAAVFSPGIRPDADVTRAALAAGATIIPEIELAASVSDAPVIAITGSNGKSTVTAMTGAILAEAGLLAPVCGNIGRALSDAVLDELTGKTTPDAYVLEVSSFQAYALREFHPRYAAILNIQPDHIDWHGSLDAYADAKLRLTRNMGADDWLVYNPDDAALVDRLPNSGVRLLPFAFEPDEIAPPASWVAEGKIWWWAGERKAAIMDVAELGVIGPHNQTNACASAALALLFGVAPEAVRGALASYRALEHRMEDCANVGGVRCINDSKATNVDATLAALAGFERGVWLILGGRDKDADFGALIPLLDERIAEILLIGEASDAIAAAIEPHVSVRRCETLQRAVARALTEAGGGDTLLLSPACTSFDQYPNFEARGRHFKELVAAAAAGESIDAPLET